MSELDYVRIEGIELYMLKDNSIIVGEPDGMFLESHPYSNPDIVELPLPLVIDSTLQSIGDVGGVSIPRWLAEKKGLVRFIK